MGKSKIDSEKLINIGANAFVSALSGAVGSYAASRIIRAVDVVTAQQDKKRPVLGFNLSLENKEETE